MRTPRARMRSSARRVSADIRMALQRAGLRASNRSEAIGLRGSPGKTSSSCLMNGRPQVARYSSRASIRGVPYIRSITSVARSASVGMLSISVPSRSQSITRGSGSGAAAGAARPSAGRTASVMSDDVAANGWTDDMVGRRWEQSIRHP